MPNIENSGVSMVACIDKTYKKAVKISVVMPATAKADLMYSTITNLYKMANTEGATTKNGGKNEKKGKSVVFRGGKESEAAFREKLAEICRRTKKSHEWVAVYQTMIRMGIIEGVDFFTWLKWLNPICTVSQSVMAMPMSTAYKLPDVILDYGIEWDVDMLASKMANEKLTINTAKRRLNKMTVQMEKICDLLSGI